MQHCVTFPQSSAVTAAEASCSRSLSHPRPQTAQSAIVLFFTSFPQSPATLAAVECAAQRGNRGGERDKPPTFLDRHAWTIGFMISPTGRGALGLHVESCRMCSSPRPASPHGQCLRDSHRGVGTGTCFAAAACLVQRAGGLGRPGHTVSRAWPAFVVRELDDLAAGWHHPAALVRADGMFIPPGAALGSVFDSPL